MAKAITCHITVPSMDGGRAPICQEYSYRAWDSRVICEHESIAAAREYIAFQREFRSNWLGKGARIVRGHCTAFPIGSE